jgi:tetratricopeptide (TPR) repeat protein
MGEAIPTKAINCFRTKSADYYNKVIEWYEKDIKLNPNSENNTAFTHLRIGDILLSGEGNVTQNYDKALECYKRILDVELNHSEEFYSLNQFYYYMAIRGTALAYLGKKDYDKAIEYLEKALELKPGWTWAYQSISEAYEAKGDKPKAAECKKKAEKLGYRVN